MNLNFTAPITVQTNLGDMYLETAIPTREFWIAWRFNKSVMSEAGLSVTKINGNLTVRRLSRHDRDKIIPVKVDSYLVRYKDGLLDYQPEVVSYLCASLLSHNICIDGSDAGCGKTYTSLAVCRELRLRPCIICTKTMISIWGNICRRFGLNPLFIMNWESAITRMMSDGKGKPKRLVSGNPYCRATQNQFTGKLHYKWNLPKDRDLVFIFDECHKANGYGTSQQKIFLAAAEYPVIALSATLAEKPESLRAIGNMCKFFELDKFQDWLEKQGCFKNTYNRWESVSARQDMARIGKLIFPSFGYRVRKQDIPGFPEIQNIAEVYPILKVEKYNAAYQEVIKQLQKTEDLKEALKERKALTTDEDVIKRLQTKIREAQANKLTLNLRYRQFTEFLKVDLFCDLLHEHLDNGLSVVVFVNFTETLKAIAKKLRCKCMVWGEQSQNTKGMEQREKFISDFQDDKERVILCNIQAGGVSISLHDLNGIYPRVALISPTHSAITLTQALGRIHRAGSKSKAMNKLIYAAGTVEESVCRNVSSKLDCIAALNDNDLADSDIFNLMKGEK